MLSSRPGGVVWVSVGDAGATFLGTEELETAGAGLTPVTSDTWLTLQGPARVTGKTSRALCREGTLLAALAEFHRLILGAEQINRVLLLADEANEQTALTLHRQRDEERARQSLFGVLGSSRTLADDSDSTLMAALRIIGEREGIEFQPPTGRRRSKNEELSLQQVLADPACAAARCS